MRKYKYYTLLSLLTVLLLGCNESDFLEEIPVSNISVPAYFKTPAQFDEAVVGAYTFLRPLSEVFFWSAGEMRSDNTTFQHNSETQSGYNLWDLDKFTTGGGSEDDILDPAWNNLYAGIGRCNTVLTYIQDADDFDKKNQYVAEAKFLRAFYYFNLVKYWGNIPLVTTKAESMQSAFENNKQVSPEVVYAQILKDLNEAKNDLPLSHPASSRGRVTQGAVRMLLADVLMFTGKYGEATAELQQIVGSGQYSLVSDYSKLFGVAYENNAEFIFDVQNIEGASYGQSSYYMYRFVPWNIGQASTKVYGFPFNIVGSGSNGMNIPTEDLIRSFEKGDVRLNLIDTTFVDLERPVFKNSIVPFTLKFVDYAHAREGQTGVNFPLYRYPHVLLSLAECYLRVGGGDPLPFINQVRERAQLEPLTTVTLDDIIHERRVEFNCECDRWSVLLRTGLAKEVMAKHAVEERKRIDIPETAYPEIQLLFPIPSFQLEIDSNLKQNPEYL